MRRLAALAALVLGVAAVPARAHEGSRFHPGVTSRLGVIATESPAAARAGRAVLERGGNAIDAAVTTVFALGVARPQSCGVGGGGFLLYRRADGRVRGLDFRETAGAQASPAMFTDPGLSKTFTGHETVGVPGVVAGMAAALRRYGTIRLATAIAPAERLAREGFRVPLSLQGSSTQNADRLRLFPASAAQYLPGGQPLKADHLIAEAQRIAWADRNAYLADPAFVHQPVAELTSKAYAARRRAEIPTDRTAAYQPGTLSSTARARLADIPEHNPAGSTTHVSVIDRH